MRAELAGGRVNDLKFFFYADGKAVSHELALRILGLKGTLRRYHTPLVGKLHPSHGGPAISELCRAPGEEAGIGGGFLLQRWEQQGGAYFLTDLFLRCSRAGNGLVWQSGLTRKMATGSFSAGLQLLSEARGRERLSHKRSSNWALLCTGCLPRWRYRSR